MKTFFDSGVLLTAWKRGTRHEQAVSLLDDDSLEFVTCDNVRLELLPKPIFEKRQAEIEFYNAHFQKASACEPFSEALGQAALALAKKYGLAAGDALNLTSAIRLGANEFITSELPGKPMFRVAGIKIKSLHSF